MSDKLCPKCGKQMTPQAYTLGLPGYIDQSVPNRTGNRISTQQAFPVVAYWCADGCRYIELYAE